MNNNGNRNGDNKQGGSYSKRPEGKSSYSRPAGAPQNRERRFAKPGDSRPASTSRYGKPAEGAARPSRPAGDRSFSRPAGARPSGDRPAYGRPADGERRYGKPAEGAARPSRPAGDRSFSRPAGARPSGDRPAYGRPSDGERRYSKPAEGGARPSRPAGDRSFSRPAGARPSGDRPAYGRPAEGGARPSRSFGGRSFSKPSGPRRDGARPFNHTDGPRSSGPRYSNRPSQGDATPVERTELTAGARRTALDVLHAVHEKGAYASLALQEHLTRAKLSPADRRLTTSIVYSTLEQQLQIDFALDRLMDHPTSDPMQRDILRLSACQILFHDRVPDSAAVNEGVNLARALGLESAAGFLNAVLRNLVRGKDEIPWPKREDDLRQYLHIMGSTPLWLVDKLTAVYGEELASEIILYRSKNHEMVLRPNMMNFTDETFEELLAKKAWTWRKGIAPHAYLVSGATEIAMDNDYRNGNFSIQGQSSILAAEAMQVKTGMRLLDACAAPGGKSAYMAEQMQGTGRVFAWELHERRALLLESAKRRLKLENLRISIRDASDPKPDFESMMDGVLLDAPCSGLGVLSEKPDLKYRLKEEDIAAICATQKKLLDALCVHVRPGGVLVYSTCSILPEENALQVEAFLSEHPEFTLEPLPSTYPESILERETSQGLQLFAHRDDVEGFYIARMRKAKG